MHCAAAAVAANAVAAAANAAARSKRLIPPHALIARAIHQPVWRTSRCFQTGRPCGWHPA